MGMLVRLWVIVGDGMRFVRGMGFGDVLLVLAATVAGTRRCRIGGRWRVGSGRLRWLLSGRAGLIRGSAILVLMRRTIIFWRIVRGEFRAY